MIRDTTIFMRDDDDHEMTVMMMMTILIAKYNKIIIDLQTPKLKLLGLRFPFVFSKEVKCHLTSLVFRQLLFIHYRIFPMKNPVTITFFLLFTRFDSS